MPINLSALTQATTTARSLAGLILVSPQDVGIQAQQANDSSGDVRRSPDSFFFDFKGEESIDLVSDITDHYVEDNSAIADQIALRPEELKTEGFVSELNDVTPTLLAPVRLASEKLTLISGYIPSLSVTALRAYNVAFQAYQTAKVLENSAVQSWDTLVNDGNINVITGTETEQEIADLRASQKNQNKQQIAFQKFYGYWRARTLFTVQTPWAIFKNMAIKSVRAIQDPDSESFSTFQVQFKIMRFANVQTTGPINPDNATGRTSTQASSSVNLGSSTPRTADDISISSVLGSFN